MRCSHGSAAHGVQRPARHALAEHHLDDAAFHQRQHAHRPEVEDHERHADDQHGQSRRHRDASHDPGEVEDPGRQRQQHVEQRRVRARLGGDAEESPQPRFARRRRRRAQRGLHGDFGIAIDVGDFLRRAVAAGDRGDHLCLGLAGVLREFRAQVFLGVVQRVLHQRGIGAGERRTQLRQVRGNGGRLTVHRAARVVVPDRTESRESRVAAHAAVQACRTSRPGAVMR